MAKGIGMDKKNPNGPWSLAIITMLTFSISPVLAVGDNVGSTGSVTITKHLNNAAKAFAIRDYATAKSEYRIAIGLSPESIEFYYGLYDVCVHSGEWDQVAFALEKIFELDPSKKQQLGAQYGEALYHMKRYEEAIPVLKQALKDADLPMPKIALVVPPPAPEPDDSSSKTPSTAPSNSLGTSAVNPAAQAVAIGTNAVAPTPINLYPKTFASVNVNEGELGGFTKTFQNAVRSECILVAEYRGFEASPDIAFYHPPQANYHITKILKGPPLNRDLPVRFEFHDHSKATAPAGWKFGLDKMPEKGSSWIIFIQNAVPRERMFDTYQGSYGRQPATEENLNQVYALLEGSANR